MINRFPLCVPLILLSTILFFTVLGCNNGYQLNDYYNDHIVDVNDMLIENEGMIESNKPYNAFFLVNTGCPDCINKIATVNALASEIENINFSIICFAEDRFIFLEYLLQEGKIQHENIRLFKDIDGVFFVNNQNLRDLDTECLFITDSQNKLLATDIPLDIQSVSKMIKKID